MLDVYTVYVHCFQLLAYAHMFISNLYTVGEVYGPHLCSAVRPTILHKQ